MELKSRGYQVMLFAEWRSRLHPEYVMTAPKGIPVFLDCWYFLPLTFADVCFTPAAKKHYYYPKRCKRVSCFHSLASLGGFPSDGFTHYDFILCGGPHHVDELDQYFKERGLRDRYLIPSGYPKLDQMYRMSRPHRQELNKNKKTIVLYCPTYFNESASFSDAYAQGATLVSHGEEILETLIKHFSVIFRPHPLNLKHKNLDSLMRRIKDRYRGRDDFEFDDSQHYGETYEKSSFMVTDISGTAYTYALSTGKPVLFFDKGVESDEFQFVHRNEIGSVVTDMKSMMEKAEEIIHNEGQFIKTIEKARKELVFNFGSSDQAFADSVENILNDTYPASWKKVA